METNTVLFCRLDGSTFVGREQQRLLCLEESGLLSFPPPSVLTELLEVAVQLLDFPLAWIGLMERNLLRFQCTFGLSELGLNHNLIQKRSLPRLETFCTYVVDSEQLLGIENTFTHPVFAQSDLTQIYGIRSYLGAPLLWSDEQGDSFCVGTIALLDRQPRRLLPSDRRWVQILSRWCVSEYALSIALKNHLKVPGDQSYSLASVPVLESSSGEPSDIQMRLQSINDLVQNCHNPMTAIMGMTRMLEQEIYGSLTPKQREYVEVISHSSQTLLLQAQEIQSLSNLPRTSPQDCILPTDLSLVSQNLIQQLAPIAQENNIDLDFSAEQSSRQWYGESEYIRQILNHLLQGVLAPTTAPGTLHLHLSYPPQHIKFTLWFLNLWVDDPHPSSATSATTEDAKSYPPDPPVPLRLTYCQQLVEKLNGTFSMEDSAEMGKRYTILLPQTEPYHLNP
jgi:hypothetical protein